MATTTFQVTGVPALSADIAAAVAVDLQRSVSNRSGAYGRNAGVASVVRTVPGAPTSPAGTSAVAHSVITWVAPTTGSPVTHYQIDIRKASDNSLLRTDFADGSLLTFDVLGLAANTSYAVVTPFNEVGAGTASANSANFTTT